MTEPVDHEIDAIKAVLAALTPLSERARVSVLDYVTRRLEVSPGAGRDATGKTPAGVPPAFMSEEMAPAVHIKTFKEGKKPRSANEMAAVVAYYLANVADPTHRKLTINQKDIETQFKIAGFPLPKQVRMTLTNARNAGYFDMAGDGEYRLNAVGHNLVAHSMPRGSGKATGMRKARKAKERSKKSRQAKKKRS